MVEIVQPSTKKYNQLLEDTQHLQANSSNDHLMTAYTLPPHHEAPSTLGANHRIIYITVGVFSIDMTVESYQAGSIEQSSFLTTTRQHQCNKSELLPSI